MRNRKTTVYLTETVRRWVTEKAKKEGLSRSCFVYWILRAAMEEDDEDGDFLWQPV